MAARVVDERVPLSVGVLGQETTGAGGFAMGMRSIPVLMDIVEVMRQVCPNAWLINFANPAGMMAEAVLRVAGWWRAVGICDGPSSMHHTAATLLQASLDEVHLDYFGLNHLGWVRRVKYQGKDYLPDFIAMIQQAMISEYNSWAGGIPHLPFPPELIVNLGMIPNEYLYFYYFRQQAVQNILIKDQTRGEQILYLNGKFFDSLKRLHKQGNQEGMMQAYLAYLEQRQQTYMQTETGGKNTTSDSFENAIAEAASDEGYAGVALDLIEALHGGRPKALILNILSQGAIHGMADEDVVEIPAWVSQDAIQPQAVGTVPDHCLGLMMQVKEYERLTIAAALEGSYDKARQALTLHPLVGDYELAKVILDGYVEQHGNLFPKLN
jgi:6-phospho-beta-glucosidase